MIDASIRVIFPGYLFMGDSFIASTQSPTSPASLTGVTKNRRGNKVGVATIIHELLRPFRVHISCLWLGLGIEIEEMAKGRVLITQTCSHDQSPAHVVNVSQNTSAQAGRQAQLLTMLSKVMGWLRKSSSQL